MSFMRFPARLHVGPDTCAAFFLIVRMRVLFVFLHIFKFSGPVGLGKAKAVCQVIQPPRGLGV
jgi:hypothetical protein